jgi:hypothetical protein
LPLPSVSTSQWSKAREAMTLAELIKVLESRDPNQFVRYGFCYPHSYRGYYHDLAFIPTKDTTVGQMLKEAREAVGSTYGGWKGDEFTMGEHSTCWLSNVGVSSCESFGPKLLAFMLGEEPEWE